MQQRDILYLNLSLIHVLSTIVLPNIPSATRVVRRVGSQAAWSWREPGRITALICRSQGIFFQNFWSGRALMFLVKSESIDRAIDPENVHLGIVGIYI